ncbi:MAG: translesion error-prone DNA polymerase V autoproteolytic subunit [Candidatus Kapabacteria bacterium]|nr:translesion error-prone DNA polymerase V autoproteolytic subunit [Ignavibacteriota bacterium]MCW5886278.1 translesion error-prone DNA polymerase V autoproteolytic subunit [Candidatus Kapabacteria bacterium]
MKSNSLIESTIKDTDTIEILKPERLRELNLPLFLESVSAGFPSPADDYMEAKLDLNELLIKNPAATFFVRVMGDSMIKAGIYSGDILVVDRSLDPKDGSIVIAVINGELTVKRLSYQKGEVFLLPENKFYSPIKITDDMSFEVWGVVRSVIHSVM